MKTIKHYYFVATAILVLLATGCADDFFIRGNGIERSENRFVTPFAEVVSSGSFVVHITPDDDYSVVVNAESNLLPYIDTDVNRGRLEIGIRGFHSVRNTRPMEVYVSMPNLESIGLSGSGTVTTGFFAPDRMKLAVSGSGRIETAFDARVAEMVVSGSGKIMVSGSARQCDVRISGSGDVYAYDLPVNDCTAAVSGSGDLFVRASRSLMASISGSGNVFYIGNPVVQASISGSGKVIKEY